MENKFELLKQYLGVKLLEYILNIEQMKWENTLSELNINSIQNEVISELFEEIQNLRIQYVLSGKFGDAMELNSRLLHVNRDSIFNKYREKCGGVFPIIEEEDSILSFLKHICIKEYSNLLMKPINQSYYNSFFSFNSKYEYGDEFINLVKDDVLDNLTNKLDGDEYCFHVSLENDFISMCQVAIAYETIIKRAFINSCNRMKYNLEDVLTEIDNLIFGYVPFDCGIY